MAIADLFEIIDEDKFDFTHRDALESQFHEAVVAAVQEYYAEDRSNASKWSGVTFGEIPQDIWAKYGLNYLGVADPAAAAGVSGDDSIFGDEGAPVAAHATPDDGHAVMIRFKNPEDSETADLEVGPFPWVKLTNDALRVGPEGTRFAHYNADHDEWYLYDVDDYRSWTDVVISPVPQGKKTGHVCGCQKSNGATEPLDLLIVHRHWTGGPWGADRYLVATPQDKEPVDMLKEAITSFVRTPECRAWINDPYSVYVRPGTFTWGDVVRILHEVHDEPVHEVLVNLLREHGLIFQPTNSAAGNVGKVIVPDPVEAEDSVLSEAEPVEDEKE